MDPSPGEHDHESAPRVVRHHEAAPQATGDRPAPVASRRISVLWLSVGLFLVALGASTVWVAYGIGAPQDPGPSAAPAAPATGSATPLLSPRRVPGFTTAMVPVRAMAAAVAPVAEAAPARSCLSVGDGTGDLYSHLGSEPLVPASNQKLLTAAVVLAELGADHTLTTRFASATAPVGGVVNGDLYMIGGGDPLLTTDAYQALQSDDPVPETDLEAVADQLVAGGLRRVTGSVVGDAGRYDAQQSLPGWPRRWFDNRVVAPLSALVVNDGWLVDPVTGEGPGGPAPDPAQHAAATMTRLLTDRGVVVDGPPLSGASPAETVEVESVASLPTSEIVEQLLTFSDNTTAELLVKELGVHSGGGGTTAAGVDVLVEWTEREGLAQAGWVVVDGSGLSSENRLTCSMLAALLRRDGADGTISTSLAVPQEPGTLEDRFDQGDMDERLKAKTGTLNQVAALSGWFRTVHDVELDFEFVINTEDRRISASDLKLQTQLFTALLGQPVPPPLQQAGPLDEKGD